MNIEFKNLQDKFQIIEHAIRKSTAPDADNTSNQKSDYLQARLLLKKFHDEYLNFSISYYGAENEFIGLDNSGEVYITKSKDMSVALSTPIDVPENTDRVIVRFIFEDEINADNGFYETIFKIGLTLLVGWLALSLLKSFVTFFS